MIRLAIIDENKCKPKKCKQECKKGCPVNKQGKICIDIEEIANISDQLCIGCGICVKACPFNAIKIVNLPSELAHSITYKYGENRFQLHKFPILKKGYIIGLLGINGIGKSTILSLLTGDIKFNFGEYDKQLEYSDITLKLKSNPSLKKFFTENKDIKISHKRQNIEKYKTFYKNSSTNVEDIILKSNEKTEEYMDYVMTELDLHKLHKSKLCELSGGEFQRVVCATTLLKIATLYIFDEPTSFLDIKQRLKVGKLIKELSTTENYVIIVEHDLSILEYISDQICLMYGSAGAYGVVTQPYTSSRAINNFFQGYIPSENLQFRKEAFNFKSISDKMELQDDEKIVKKLDHFTYPDDVVQYDNFKLVITSGSFQLHSGIIVIFGQNGTGKTTFLKTIASKLSLKFSVKTQDLYFDDAQISVAQYLNKKIGKTLYDPFFSQCIINNMGVGRLMDYKLHKLSGGEKQIVAIIECLGHFEANSYLIDEPSAYLDIEQRINIAMIIRRYMYHYKKSCFIVEHDLLMSTYLASDLYSNVIIFEEKTGQDIRCAIAHKPTSLSNGMNLFLKQLDITFSRDPENHRPRINKYNSVKDKEQKKLNKYFLI